MDGVNLQGPVVAVAAALAVVAAGVAANSIVVTLFVVLSRRDVDQPPQPFSPGVRAVFHRGRYKENTRIL